MEPARFSSRAAAFHIDALIFTFVFEAFHIYILRVWPDGVSNFAMFALFCAVVTALSILPTRYFGQTLGKKICGLKVVNANGSSSELPWFELVQRELIFKTISSFAFGLGFWRARRSADRKAWHDEHVGTKVIAVRAIAPGGLPTWFFEGGVSLVTTVAGVLLILAAFFYTPLPLRVLKTALVATGNPVSGLEGSLASGLLIREIQGGEPGASYDFKNLKVNVSLLRSFREKQLVLSSLTLDSVTVEVPGKVSWQGLVTGMLTSLTTAPNVSRSAAGTATALLDASGVDTGLEMGADVEGGEPPHFSIDELRISNLSLVHNKESVGYLSSLLFSELVVKDSSVRVNSWASSAEGLRLHGGETTFIKGVLSFALVQGQVSNSLVPILKAPVDFTLSGTYNTHEVPLKRAQLKGELLQRAGAFSLSNGHFSMSVKQTYFPALWTSQTPIGTVDIKVEGTGESVTEILAKAESAFVGEICGQTGDFRTLEFMIRNPETFTREIASEKKGIENLLQFKKVKNVQTFCTKTVSEGPQEVAARSETSQFVLQAQSLLRAGKVQAAREAIDRVHTLPPGLSPEQLGAFYGLKGWIYLTLKYPGQASEYFESAYKYRKGVSDLEGVLRAEEASPTPDPARIEKWTKILTDRVKASSLAFSQLSASFQKRFKARQ